MVLELTSAESIEKYDRNSTIFNINELQSLFKVCAALKIGNRTTYTSVVLFLECIEIQYQPDLLLTLPTCVYLACKLHDKDLPIKQILLNTINCLEVPVSLTKDIEELIVKEINAFERNLIYFFKFKLDFSNPYTILQEIVKDIKFEENDYKTTFIIINDILQFTMSAKWFTSDEIAYSGLLVFFLVFPEKLYIADSPSQNRGEYTFDNIVDNFKNKFVLEDWQIKLSIFMATKILECYESAQQIKNRPFIRR